MVTVMRVFVVLITALATFFFVYWVPFSLIPRIDLLPWIPPLGSLVCALVVARYIWRRSASISPSFITCVVMGAAVTGAIGFSAGFFGPMLLAPGANQGPLLGIFFTGPLGFLLGAVGGGIYWARSTRRG
jgi:hypothetical protein